LQGANLRGITALTEKKRIRVVAALIRDESDGRILITRRLNHGEFGGYWEFPGGKVEPGESDAQALMRELIEELDLAVEVIGTWYSNVFEYRNFVLDFQLLSCRSLGGEISMRAVADFKWVLPHELAGFSFPPADAVVVSRLANAHNT